jgi:hypothetical protein
MWYVNAAFSEENVATLPAAGFALSNTRGVVRIQKYDCGAELRRGTDNDYHMTELPTIMVNGQFAILWDAGYQKFLVTHEKHKVPARREQLANLRRFNEELRTALGVPTYYNEALGSTCGFSVYDRLKGRPGANPDESVGVEPGEDH